MTSKTFLRWERVIEWSLSSICNGSFTATFVLYSAACPLRQLALCLYKIKKKKGRGVIGKRDLVREGNFNVALVVIWFWLGIEKNAVSNHYLRRGLCWSTRMEHTLATSYTWRFFHKLWLYCNSGQMVWGWTSLALFVCEGAKRCNKSIFLSVCVSCFLFNYL